MGVTPQTCHKVLEVCIKPTVNPARNQIPPYKLFNSPGNRHEEYLSSILCKFLDLPKISSPDQYHSIQSLFLDSKKQILGYCKCFDRNKSNSEDIQNLQLMFRESLDCMFAEKTNLSVMRAKLCKKALYLGFTKQRSKQYSSWLKKLENPDYSKRTRLLFSELRAKNRGIETFNAIRNPEGSLSESQKECLFYWSQYCQDMYRGHKTKDNEHIPIENETMDSPIEFSEFLAAISSLNRNKSPVKDRITNEDIKLLLPQESNDCETSEMALNTLFNLIEVFWEFEKIPVDLKRVILRPF